MARSRSVGFAALLAALALSACKKSAPPPSAAPVPSVVASAQVPPKAQDAVFSLPVSGVRIAGATVAVGLVAAEKLIRAERIGDDGAIAWTKDAITDVVWSDQTELHALSVGSSVAVVFRGLHSGRRGVVATMMDGQGGAIPAFEMGTAWCGTLDGLVWTAPLSTSGEARRAAKGRAEAVVYGRRPEDKEPKELGRVAAEEEVSIACGDHRAFVLVEAEDMVSVLPVSFAGDPSTKLIPFARDRDFASDEEREQETFTVEDTLYRARVGASGVIALRELSPSGVKPWHKLKTTLGAEDELVAIDGDGTNIGIVFQRDADKECPAEAATAVSLHAITVNAKSLAETSDQLTPAKCGTVFGPATVTVAKGGLLATWVERKAAGDKVGAPVEAISFRRLVPLAEQAGRAVQAAESIVDVACDEAGCSAVALARPEGADGKAPEPIRVVKLK